MPVLARCELSLNDNCECLSMAYNYVGKKRAVAVPRVIRSSAPFFSLSFLLDFLQVSFSWCKTYTDRNPFNIFSIYNSKLSFSTYKCCLEASNILLEFCS